MIMTMHLFYTGAVKSISPIYGKRQKNMKKKKRQKKRGKGGKRERRTSVVEMS